MSRMKAWTNRIGFSVGVGFSFIVCHKVGLKKVSDDPWKLLSLASSEQETIRMSGVRALASKKLPGWLCVEIAQACDERGLIALSGLGSDIPECLPTRPLQCNFDSVQEILNDLLSELLLDCSSECARFHSELALDKKRVPVTSEEELMWDEPGERADVLNFAKARPNVKRLLLSLEALNCYAKILSASNRILEKDVVGILETVWDRYRDSDSPSDHQIRQLCLRILCNLALKGKKEARSIVSSGWLKILNKCIRSKQSLDLELLSRKTIANLDSSLTGNRRRRFRNGIFPIHSPQWDRGDVDFVFVHGLRGGLFKTWRQKDPPPRKNPKKQTEADQLFQSEVAERTRCWPKDWLPADLPFTCRVIGVDYSSFLSDWGKMCPEEKKLRSIEKRSRDLGRKLEAVGVGERPIIWVCHSMGGLIVKQILTEVWEETAGDFECNPLMKQTVGCVFFSTPHLGSSIASKSLAKRYRYLLMPGTEVEQLAEHSPFLRVLNQKFEFLVRKFGVGCLNVAESEKSTIKVAGWTFREILVPSWSADPGFGDTYTIAESHLSTCKPENRDAVIYQMFLDFVKAVYDHNVKFS